MPIDNNRQSVQNNSQPPFVWQNSQILQQNKSNNFLIFVQQNNKTSTTNQQQQTVSEMLQNLKDVKLDTNSLNVCEPVSTRVEKPIMHEFSLTQEKKIPTLDKPYSTNTNVTKELFDGSAEDINAYLKGSKLEGMGQVFIDIQNKYHINALFLMGIAKVESGYGNQPKKSCKFNIVGAGGVYPKTYTDSINGLGRNLSKNYISSGLTTPSKIRNKYCKGNKTWPQKVSAEMNEIRNFLKKRYEL